MSIGSNGRAHKLNPVVKTKDSLQQAASRQICSHRSDALSLQPTLCWSQGRKRLTQWATDSVWSYTECSLFQPSLDYLADRSCKTFLNLNHLAQSELYLCWPTFQRPVFALTRYYGEMPKDFAGHCTGTQTFPAWVTTLVINVNHRWSVSSRQCCQFTHFPGKF